MCRFLFILCLLLGTLFTAQGQIPSEYDVSFNYGRGANYAFDQGTYSDGNITCTKVATNGKVYIGGDFKYFAGDSAGNLVRLNQDGTFDKTFRISPSFGKFRTIADIHVLPNGQVLAVSFLQYSNRIEVYRFNVDGTVDGSLNTFGIPSTGTRPVSMAVASNGKIYILDSKNDIYKLNSNGSIDRFFTMGTGFANNNKVRKIIITNSDKIFAIGDITQYDGNACKGVCRINIDGSFDTGFTFNPAYSTASCIDIQHDAQGTLYAIGTFTTSATSNKWILKLDNNGQEISNYASQAIFNSNAIVTANVADNGAVVALCDYTVSQTVKYKKLYKFNNIGWLDATFNAPAVDSVSKIVFNNGTRAPIFILNTLPNNKVVMTGDFIYYGLDRRNNFLAINVTGEIDRTYSPIVGANDEIKYIKQLLSQKLLIGGRFTRYNNKVVNGLAILHLDGGLDTTFYDGSNYNGAINFASEQADGKLIVGGQFSRVGNRATSSLVRVSSDGELDTSFKSPSNFGWFYAGIIQPDGKVLVIGYSNTLRANALIKLNADGSRDTSHAIVPNAVPVGFQRSGKLIVLSGTTFSRLNNDGTTDNTYTSYNCWSCIITSTSMGQNDELYFAANPGQSSLPYLNRLNPDGARNAGFIPPATLNRPTVYSAVLALPTGKVLAAASNTIQRLNGNGTLDVRFFDRGGENGSCLALQSDGKYLFGGNTQFYDGYNLGRIGRLWGDYVITSSESTMLAANKLHIYPNPASSVLNVQVAEGTNLNYQVLNQLGQVILKGQLSAQTNTIDTGRLAAGAYILRTNQGTARFLVQ